MSEVEKLILEKLDVLSQDVREVKEEAVKANEKSEQAKNAISATQVFLENVISRKINIIGEGHEFLNLRLDDALSFKSKSERMELEVLDLRMEVKKIKAHLNIA